MRSSAVVLGSNIPNRERLFPLACLGSFDGHERNGLKPNQTFSGGGSTRSHSRRIANYWPHPLGWKMRSVCGSLHHTLHLGMEQTSERTSASLAFRVGLWRTYIHSRPDCNMGILVDIYLLSFVSSCAYSIRDQERSSALWGWAGWACMSLMIVEPRNWQIRF